MKFARMQNTRAGNINGLQILILCISIQSSYHMCSHMANELDARGIFSFFVAVLKIYRIWTFVENWEKLYLNWTIIPVLYIKRSQQTSNAQPSTTILAIIMIILAIPAIICWSRKYAGATTSYAPKSSHCSSTKIWRYYNAVG